MQHATQTAKGKGCRICPAFDSAGCKRANANDSLSRDSTHLLQLWLVSALYLGQLWWLQVDSMALTEVCIM